MIFFFWIVSYFMDKGQKTMSLSLAEAKYGAMIGTCCELSWLQRFVNIAFKTNIVILR